MKAIKKTIVLLLIALGFIILLAESDGGFIDTLTIKAVGICLFFAGIQLCATWHLFTGFLDKD